MPTRDALVGMLPGMRMRQLWQRNTELYEDLREEFRLNREERVGFRDELAARHEEMRAEREETREALRAERAEAARKLESQSDAQIGALTDLAKEVRSWSSGGGAPPAAA